jgi:hypothetical protein
VVIDIVRFCEEPDVVRLACIAYHMAALLSHEEILLEGGESTVVFKFSTAIIVFRGLRQHCDRDVLYGLFLFCSSEA